MTNPCKGCTERRVGCHGGCEAYEGYRRYLDDQNAVRKREKEAESYYCARSARVAKWLRNHDYKGGGHDG